MNVKERIAYIRGLIEGAEFYGKDAQARNIWENLLRICEELADEVADLGAGQDELEEYVEAVDNDLSDVEGELYGYEDDDLEEGLSDEEHVVEMECPKCGEEVFFEEGFLYDSDVEVSCPECGTVVYATGTSASDDAEGFGDKEKNPANHGV